MRAANETTSTVTTHESIEIPRSVSIAFNRSLNGVSRSDSFIDRVFALGDVTNAVLAWRYAGVIDKRQLSHLLRKIRKVCQEDLGAITENDYPSAVDLFDQDVRERNKRKPRSSN